MEEEVEVEGKQKPEDIVQSRAGMEGDKQLRLSGYEGEGVVNLRGDAVGNHLQAPRLFCADCSPPAGSDLVTGFLGQKISTSSLSLLTRSHFHPQLSS